MVTYKNFIFRNGDVCSVLDRLRIPYTLLVSTQFILLLAKNQILGNFYSLFVSSTSSAKHAINA